MDVKMKSYKIMERIFRIINVLILIKFLKRTNVINPTIK